MSERRESTWPVVLLGLAGIAVHASELLGGRPYFRDLYQVYVPAKHYLAERLNAGELPQWWPWDGGGSPLIPQPVFSVFHPTTLLYLLLPFWKAFAMQNLCGTWMALFGAYALGRTLGQSRPAATVSGALYGLNGYVACLTEHQFMKLSAGTMPWYLAAIVVAHRRGGAWLVLPSLAMGLLLLAGDPQIAILSSIAGVALLFIDDLNWKRSLVAFVSPFAGAALAAVQLVPSILVMGDTERSVPVTSEKWTLEWKHFAGMLWPMNYGATDWVRSTFIGLPGILLVLIAIAGLRSRDTRTRLVLIALAFGSAWLAFGNAGHLNQLAREVLPFWARLRYPMKSVVLAYLAVSVLAGFGFDQVARRWTWPSAAVMVGYGVAFAIPLFPTMPPDFYDPSPIVKMLQAQGVGLTGSYFDRPLASLHDESQWPIDARNAGGGLGTSLGAMWDLPSITPSMPGSSWRVLELFDAAHRENTNGKLLGAFGVADVVLPEPIEERLRPQVLMSDSGFSVVEMKHRVPKAYVVERAKVIRSEGWDDLINAVSAPDFLPGREVILEDYGWHDKNWHTDWAERPATAALPAVIDPSTPSNVVRVRATLPASGFVVLNQAYFYGCLATLDGRKGLRPYYFQANGFAQAVEAPAGEHVVEFRYDTPGLDAGAVTSLLAALFVLAGALLLRQRPQRLA